MGVYSDWNLFAALGIPLSVLIWYNLLKAEDLWHRPVLVQAMFWVFGMHSYSWIVANHFR